MRRPPSRGEWMMTRLCWTMVGVFLGLALGVELVEWFLGWFLDWDGAFWTIILMHTAGGAIGLWLDIRSAREWRLFKRPEDEQTGVPSENLGRRPRRRRRFKRLQDQQRSDR